MTEQKNITTTGTADTGDLTGSARKSVNSALPDIFNGHSDSSLLSPDTAVLAGMFARYAEGTVDSLSFCIRKASEDAAENTGLIISCMSRLSAVKSYMDTINDAYRPNTVELYKVTDPADYLTELQCRAMLASAHVNRLQDILLPLPVTMALSVSDYKGMLKDTKAHLDELIERIKGYRTSISSYKTSDDLPDECFDKVEEISTITWYATAFNRFIEAVCPEKKIKPTFDFAKIRKSLDYMVSIAHESLQCEKLGEGAGSVRDLYDQIAEGSGETYNDAYKEVKEILIGTNDICHGMHLGHITSESIGYYVEAACETDEEADQIPEEYTRRFDTEKEAEEAVKGLRKICPGVSVLGVVPIHDDNYYTVLTSDNINTDGMVYNDPVSAFAHLVVKAKPEKIIKYLEEKGAVERGRCHDTTDVVREHAKKRHDGEAVPEDVRRSFEEILRQASAGIDFSEKGFAGASEWIDDLNGRIKDILPDGAVISSSEGIRSVFRDCPVKYFPVHVTMYDKDRTKRYTMAFAVMCTLGDDDLYSADSLVSALAGLMRLGMIDENTFAKITDIGKDEIMMEDITPCMYADNIGC